MAWYDLEEEEKATPEQAIPVSKLVPRVAGEQGVPVSRLKAQGQFLNAPPPRTFGEEFSVGLDRGEDQLRGLGYGLVGLMSDALGVKAGADWGYDNYRQAMEEAASKQATITDPFEEIESFSDAGRYAVGLIGEQIPQLIASVAGGGVGGFVGKTLAKRMVANEVLKRVAAGATATAAEREVAEEVTKNLLNRAAAAKVAEEGAEQLGLAGAAAATRATAQAGVTRGTRYGAVAGTYLANFGQISGGTYGQIRDETGEGGPAAVAAALGTSAGGAALDTLSELFIASRIPSVGRFLGTRGVEGKPLNVNFAGRAALGAAKGVAVGAPLEGVVEYGQTAGEQAAVGLADPNQTVGERLTAPGAERERRIAAAAGFTVGGSFAGGFGTLEALAPRTKQRLDEKLATDDRFDQEQQEQFAGGPLNIEGNWTDEVDVDGLKMRFNPNINRWAALNPPEVEGLGPAVATELSNAAVALVNPETRSGAVLAARAERALSRLQGEADTVLEEETPAPADETETDDGTELVPVETMMPRPPGRQGVGGVRPPTFAEATQPGTTIEFRGSRGVVQATDPDGSLRVDFGRTRAETTFTEVNENLSPGNQPLPRATGTEEAPVFESITPDRFNEVRVVSAEQLAREQETEAEIRRLEQELQDQSLAEEERAAKTQAMVQARQRLLPSAVAGTAFQEGPTGFTMGASEPIAVFNRRKAESIQERRRNEARTQEELQKAFDGAAVGGMRPGDKVSVALGGELVPATFAARNVNGKIRLTLDETKEEIELRPDQFQNVGFRVETPTELSDEADYNERLRNVKSVEELAQLTGGFLPAGAAHKIRVTAPGGDRPLTYRVRYLFQTPKKGKPRLTGEPEPELAAATDDRMRATPAAELGGPRSFDETLQREVTRGLAEGAAAAQGQTVGVAGESEVTIGGVPYAMIGDAQGFNEIWGRGPTGQLVMKRPLFAKFDLIVEPPPPQPGADYDQIYQRKLAEVREKSPPVFGLSAQELTALEAQQQEQARDAANGQLRMERNNFDESYRRLKRDILRSMDTGHVVTITPETVAQMEGRMGYDELLRTLQADPDVNVQPRVQLDPRGRPTGEAVPTVVSMVWRGSDGRQAPYVVTQGSKRTKNGLAQNPIDIEYEEATDPNTPEERERERRLQATEREAEARLLERQTNERAALQIEIRKAREKILEAQNKAAEEQARQEQRQALEAEVNELRGVLAQSTKQPVDDTQSRALIERRKQLIEENERAVKTNERLRKQIRENEAEIKKKLDAAKKEGNSSSYRSRMLNERDRLTEQQDVLRQRLRDSENARRRRQTELRSLETQIKETAAREKEAAAQRRRTIQNEQRRLKTTLARRERELANFTVNEAPLKALAAAQENLKTLENKVEPLENKHAQQRLKQAREQRAYRPAVFSRLKGLGSFAKIYQTDPERQLASEGQRLSAQIVETQRVQRNQEALQNMSEADRALVEEIIGLMNTVFPGADFYANRDRILSLIGRGLSQPLGETEYEQVLGTAQDLAYNSAVDTFVRTINERRARGGAPVQADPAEQTRLTKLFVSELNGVIRERLAEQARKASPSEQRLTALFDPTEGALALGVAAEDIQRVFDANPEQALEIIDELRRKPTRDVAITDDEIRAAEQEVNELAQRLDPDSTALVEARERLANLKSNARRGQVDSKGLRPLWTKLHAMVESKTDSLTAGTPGRKARARAARATGAVKKQDLTEAKKRVMAKLGSKDKNQADREARLFENMVSVLGDFYAKFNPLNAASLAVDAARKRLERERGNLLRTEQFGRPEAADPDAVIDQQALIDEAKTDPETKLLGSGSGTTPRMVLVREDYSYLRNIPPEELALVYKAAGLAYSAQKLRVWYDDPTGARLRQFEEALADLDAIDTGLTPEQEAIVEKHFARLRDIPNLPVRETPTNETETELRTTPPGVIDPGTTGLRPSGDAANNAANNRLRFAVAPSAVSGTGLDLSGLGDRELLELGAVSESLGGQLGFDAEGGLPSAGRADAEGSGSVPRPADGPAPRPRVRQPLSTTDVRELTASATRFYVDAFTRKDLKNLSDDEIYRIYAAIQTEAKGAETTLAAGGNIVAQTPQPIADLISSQSGLDLLTGMAEEARAQQMNRERVENLRKNIGALAEARAFENPTKFFESAANDPSLPQNLRILAKELLRLDGRVDWNANVAAQIATFGRNFTNQPITQKEIDRRIKTETKDGKSVFSFTIGGRRNELPVPSRRADALELRERIAEAVRRDLAISKAVLWAGRAVNIGRESAFSVYLNLNAVHDREGGAVATLLHEFEHVLLAAKLDGGMELNPVEKAALERIEAMRREAVLAEGKRRGLTGDFDQVNAQLAEISGAEANQALRALTGTQEFIIEATGNPEVFKLLAELGFGKADAQNRPVFTGALSDLWNSVVALESGVKVEANSPLGRAFTDSYLLTYSSLGDPDKEYDLGFRGIAAPKFTAPQIIKNSLVDELAAAVEQERFIREQLEARDLAGTSADRNTLAQEFSALRAEAAKQEAAREAELARGRQPTRAPRANLPDFPPAAPASTTTPKPRPPTNVVMSALTGNRAGDNVMTEEEAEQEKTNDEKRRDDLARMALETSEQDFVAAFNAARNNPDIVMPEVNVDPVTFYYTTRAGAARQLGFTAPDLDLTAEERRAVETSEGVERELSQLIAQTPDTPENAARRLELGEALRAVQIQGIRRRRARGSMFTAKELEGFVAAAEQRGNTELAAALRADLELARQSEAAVAAADKAAEKRRVREQKKAEREKTKQAKTATDDRGPAIAKKFGIIPVTPKKETPKAAKKEAPVVKAPTPEEIEADAQTAVSGLEWGAWRQIQTGDGPKWTREAKIPNDAPFWKDYQKNKEMRRSRGLVPRGNKKDGWWLVQFSAPAGSPDPNPEVNPDDRSEFSTAAAEIDALLDEEISNAEYLSLGGALSRVFRDDIIPTGQGTFVRKKLLSAVEPLMDDRATDLYQKSRFAINADANRADDLLRILAKQMRQTPVDPRRVTVALGSLENPLTDAQAEEIRRLGLTNPADAADLRSKYLRQNREAFREVQRRALASLPREMRATVAEMNGHLESLQSALQKIGILNGDLKLAVEENLGIYLNRSYAIFDNPKWVERIRKNTKVIGDAKRFLKQQLVTAEAERLRDQAADIGEALPLEEARRMAASSVSAQQVETALNRLLSVAKSPTLEILSGRIPGQKNLSILKGRGQIAPEIQKLWGVYDDPETSYGKTVLKLSSLINNHLFLGDLRQLGLEEGWFAAGPRIEKDGDEFVVVDGSGEDLFRSEDMGEAKSYMDSIDFEAPPGFVKIAAEGNDRLKPLDGVYGMSEIVEGLYQMFPPVEREKLPWVIQKAGWATGMTMAMATVGSVMSQVRNYGSGWLKYLATGNFDPNAIKLSHSLAFREQFKKYAGLNREQIRGEIEDLVRRGIFGESVAVNMIRDLVDDFKSLGMAAQQGASEFEKRFDTMLRQPAKQVWDFAQGTYTMGDNIFRGMVYFSEIENYRKAFPKWSDEQLKDNAAQIARDIYWTYSMAPRWVQDLKRGPGLVIAPFITFTTEVVRTAANTLLLALREIKSGNPELAKLGWRRVGGMTAATALPSIVGGAAMAMAGMSSDDEEDLRKFLPEWQKNNQLILFGKQGNKVSFVDMSYLDPHEYFKKPLKAFWRAVADSDNGQEAIVNGSVGMVKELLNPFMSEQLLAGAVMDVARNVDATGRRIYNPQDTTTNVANAIGTHLANVFVPGTARSLNRIGLGLTGEVSESGRAYDPVQETLAMLGGQRVNEIDLSQSLGFRAAEYNRAKRDATALFNRVALTSGSVGSGEVADAYVRANAAHLRLAAGLREAYRAARRLGLSESAAVERLRALGVSRDDIERAKTGIYEPFEPSKDARLELERRGERERITEMDRAYRSAQTEQLD